MRFCRLIFFFLNPLVLILLVVVFTTFPLHVCVLLSVMHKNENIIVNRVVHIIDLSDKMHKTKDRRRPRKRRHFYI